MDLGSLGHMICKLLNKKHAHFFPNEIFILKRRRIFTKNTILIEVACLGIQYCSIFGKNSESHDIDAI